MRRFSAVFSTGTLALVAALSGPSAAMAQTCNFAVGDSVATLKANVSAAAGTCDVIEFSGVGTIYLMTAADGLTSSKPLTLRGLPDSEVYLSGNDAAQILTQSGGHDLIIENLGFTAGIGHQGGAVSALGSHVFLTDVHFFQNRAANGLAGNGNPNPSSGGAVAADNVTLSGENLFTDNQTPTVCCSAGGAIYAIAAVQQGAAAVENRFVANSSFLGGSIWADSVSLANLSVFGSTANSYGGAIFAGQSVNLTGTSSFSNSSATSNGGGAIWSGGAVTAGDMDFVNLTAGLDGGAISALSISAGNVTAAQVSADAIGGLMRSVTSITLASLRASDVSSNTEGGVLWADSGITITGNTQLIRTRAGSNGGGLYSNGPIVLGTATFEDSVALNGRGGAIATQGDLTVTGNSLFYLTRSDGDGGAVYVGTDGTTAGNAVFQGTVSGIDSKANVHETTPNYATADGGLIYAEGNLTLQDTTLISGAETKNNGGALRVKGNLTAPNGRLIISNGTADNGGCIHVSGSATIDSLSLSRCTARAGDGGGIWADAAVSLRAGSIVNSKALGVGSAYGGGIYKTPFTSGRITVAGPFTFSNNHSDHFGGAIASWHDGISITNSRFYQNSATDSGGAIANLWGQSTEISRSSFYKNQAGLEGGAIWAISANIESSLFVENESIDPAGVGGALYDFWGRSRVLFSTFLNNKAASGNAPEIFSGARNSWDPFEIFGSIVSSADANPIVVTDPAYFFDRGGNVLTGSPVAIAADSLLLSQANLRLSAVIDDTVSGQYLVKLREGSPAIGLIQPAQIGAYLALTGSNNSSGRYLQGILDDSSAGHDLAAQSRAAAALSPGAVVEVLLNPSSPAYVGPVITRVTPEVAEAGTVVQAFGQRLESVSKLEIEGHEAEILEQSATEISFRIPEEVSTGSQDLTVFSSFGQLTVQDALQTTAGEAVVKATSIKVWTKRISETEVKVYARNVSDRGKVQFIVNGQEIAWVRAVDEGDPKLRFDSAGAYFVRTVRLDFGKNAFEIHLQGERLRRVAYTR